MFCAVELREVPHPFSAFDRCAWHAGESIRIEGSPVRTTSYGNENQRRRQLARAAFALIAVTLVGTFGFSWIEGWSFDRSLFFTLITITTVGYGDEGISEAGRLFALGLLIAGIGIASYTFALAVESAIARQLGWRKRMEKRIGNLRGHIIVCGYGRMGSTICNELCDAEATVVVVEANDEAFQAATDRGLLAVHGSASSDDVLLRAGLEHARYLVSVVDQELENIVVTLTARELRPELPIIARAECPEENRKLRRAGASRTVSPFQSGGLEVAHAILYPKVSDFLARSRKSESDVVVGEVDIQEGSPLAGVSLCVYGRRDDAQISFVALERPGKEVMLPPRGDEILQPGDLLIVAGKSNDVLRMCRRGYAEETEPMGR